MKKLTYILFLSLALLTSCNKVKPQSPSNRSRQTTEDSLAVALIIANQRIAQVADKELTDYVLTANDPTYVLDSTGYWFKYILRNEEEPIDTDTKLNLHLTVYNLKDEMLFDEQEITTINRQELLPAVAQTLLTMRRGEQMELLIPWYGAYGTTGNEVVPPYTNLKVIIETN